jgi:crotonobetainyl-CoA:carnitine CoA-transferase CaiB-like acyl-CoA transferase
VLQSRNSRLVYARLSAYGGNGEYSSQPGIDLLVQAASGMTTGMVRPDGGPQIIPFQLVDNASGHVLAQAVLAALLNRERHGVADVVRVAMYDVAVSLQANQMTLHLNKEPTPKGKAELGPDGKPRKRLAFTVQPSDAFKASDGFLVVSAYTPKHWIRFCEVIGRPDLVTDERFKDQTLRTINFYDLKDEIEAGLATKTAGEWVELLQQVGLMATLAYHWKQVPNTPLFAENELAVTVGDGERAVAVIRTPARFGSFEPAGTTAPPEAGEHNDELLNASAPVG